MAGCCSTPLTRSAEESATRESATLWLRIGLASLVAAQLMTFGLAVNLSPVTGQAKIWIHTAFALSAVAVFVLVGGDLAREALAQARKGRVVVEQLFLTGILGAFFASVHASITGHGAVYYEVVAVLLAVHTLGAVLGQRKRSQALRSADALRRQFERCRKLTCCGNEQEVPVTEVRPGDRIRLLPGDGIPVDGVVRTGTGFVRETPITGEPFPVVRRPGDTVYAGSHVLDEVLEIEVVRSAGARCLDRVLQTVEAARKCPSRIQEEADRMVRWFLPAVLMISLSTFAGWTLASGWIVGLFNALAVLVVACPCAMGLATPLGLWNTLAALAARGVVVRTGDWIERMAAVDTVVFDKTGTLSEERLQVVDMAVVPGTDRAALLAWMVAVERRSQHPVAKAMAGWGRHVQDDPAWQVGPVETLPGVGVSARLAAGDRVHTLELGNAGLLSEMDAAVLTSLEAERRAGTEYTHKLFVRLDGRLVAMTWLRESFRESAASVREALLARGLKVVVMTGDRPEHAAQLGWDGIEAGLTPEAKASRVAELEQAGHRVLFVGDGINDSAAMSRAHASLAMSEGADLARESAHAVLLGGDLAEVAWAIDRCRTTVRTIRGNIRFAFIYNFVGIALAASGVLHPVAAAFLMLASSLTVTWRSLRPVKVGPVPVPVRKKIGPVQAGIAVVCGVALGLHGPMLGWMGGWGLGTTLVFGLATLVSGVWLTANWSRRDPGPAATVYAGMLTVGTLGMLIGWLIDAGWGPVVRDGVCLCGCPKSQLGQGLFARWNWMTGGMLLASVPFLFIAFPRAWWRRVQGVCAWAGHAVFCLGGMWMGMEAAAGVMAFFPIVHPKGQFLLTFFAMVFGMCMGMLAACSVFTRLFKEQWKILNPKPNAAV